MPRELLLRRYWQRYIERMKHFGPGVISQWRVQNSPIMFIDYFPAVPGTIPEKMVFAELVRRQLNFQFAHYIGDLAITPTIREHYRPDFILTDYKVIIEVVGVYWHTRPGMWAYDSLRAFLLTASGYKFYGVTDYDIYQNVREALGKIPEIAGATIHGSNWQINERPVDPRRAIGARRRAWPKVWAEKHPRKAIKAVSAWEAAKRPRRKAPKVDTLFTQLSPELEAAALELRKLLGFEGELK